MNVQPRATAQLINYTGFGHPDDLFAARLLAYTKSTRLNMTPKGLENFMTMARTLVVQEIEYMATSIPSSWEFVDVTFSIMNVSRATAQQITRTRNASFAMQSQRVTDLSDVTWDTGDAYKDDAMAVGITEYTSLLEAGMSLEDARDVLPIGVHCNLIAKYNLRAFVELVRARDSLRVQGPYAQVVRQMKEQVLAVWPWAEAFFIPQQATAIRLIEEVARDLARIEGEQGAMYKGSTGKLAKAADLLKK